MITQTIEIVSVSGGKFHRPDNTSFNGGGSDLRDARLMRCGRSLVPDNFFETVADASSYTGGRLENHVCQHCERKVSHLWRVPAVLENGTPFNCDCSGGEIRNVTADRVEHKCGFRPSASYGSLGVWTPYRRAQIIGTDRFNWFVDYQSTPKVQA